MRSMYNRAFTMVKTVVVLAILSMIAVSATYAAPAKTLNPPLRQFDCYKLTNQVTADAPPTAGPFKCVANGKRLMVKEFGVWAPAPQGVYETRDNRKCMVDKGGVTLACMIKSW